MKKPDDWAEALFQYGLDTDNRRVYLMGDVDEDTISHVVKALYVLSDQGPNQMIQLFIDSFGGDDYQMWKLFDTLKTLQAPVSTLAMGKCMSAAPLLVAAGQKGERYAMPHCHFMIHAASTDLEGGTEREVESYLKHHKQMNTDWCKEMASHTNKTASFWKRLSEKPTDQYLTAEQALEYGLVDVFWQEQD